MTLKFRIGLAAVTAYLVCLNAGQFSAFLSKSVANKDEDGNSRQGPNIRGVERRTSKDDLKLVICARIRNEAPYLKEWIEYHRMIGFDSFLLYNHNSSDSTQCVLDSYAAQGIVTRIPDDIDKPSYNQGENAVFTACGDHLAKQNDSDRIWMLTQDPDEFLWFNSTKPRIPTVKDALMELLETNNVESVRIPRLSFGAAGHDEYQPELVMERFNKRFDVKSCPKKPLEQRRRLFNHARPTSYCNDHASSHSFDNVKSLTKVTSLALECFTQDPTTNEKRKARCHTPHRHQLADRPDIDATAIVPDGKRNTLGPRYLKEKHVFDTIAIMHYKTKSRQEFYERTCASDFVDKYRECAGCSPATYFALSESFANNHVDDRMVPFVNELKPLLAGSNLVSHCDTQPMKMPNEFLEICLQSLS